MNTPKKQVLKRLYYLRNFEALNIIVIPLAMLALWSGIEFQGILWIIINTSLVSLLLLIGSLYWHHKIAQMRDSKAISRTWLRRFRLIQVSTITLLVLATAGIFAHGVKDPKVLNAWTIGLLTMAYLEYINYFHYQLMHDTGNDFRYLIRFRKLRRAPLADDLRRLKKGG